MVARTLSVTSYVHCLVCILCYCGWEAFFSCRRLVSAAVVTEDLTAEFFLHVHHFAICTVWLRVGRSRVAVRVRGGARRLVFPAEFRGAVGCAQ